MVNFKLPVVYLLGGSIGLVLGHGNKFYGDHGSPKTVSSVGPQADDGKASSDSDPLPIRPLGEWDIKKPLSEKLNYKVNEATWVNVDVNPEGNELIFDVLGDIYTLPITGGKAKPLITGPAFEVQPKYSKDGKRILFTSDRSGIDNLWSVDRDGKSNPVPVTDEKYRFTSNGHWSPNGDKVVGVKWFTSERSIPAGTIYEYDLKNKKGKKLVGSVNEQVGVEEPIYDPNHPDLIYYSGNSVDKGTWEYSKDPHKGIFNIYSFNTTSQEKETIAGGTGGAARPTPSNSGKYLAFVRKVEFNWGLIVRELETGNEKILWEGLSRDNQESSASTGAYPRFSWTKDDQSIIIWAKGKLWNVPVDSKPIKEIPFEVDVNLDIAKTLRPKIDLVDYNCKSEFKNAAVKYYDVSNDGKKAIFIVVGKTYIKDLESNKIEEIRLPYDEENRYSPSFHPTNPNLIVQGRWNDKKMTTVEIVDVKEKKLVSELKLKPGRYDYFSLSHDGKTLALTKSSGDPISGDLLYTTKPGVYTVQLDPSFQAVENSYKLLIPGETAQAKFVNDDKKVKVGGITTTPYLFDIASGNTVSYGQVNDSYQGNEVSDDGSKIVFNQYHHVYISSIPSNTTDYVYWSKPGSQPKDLIRLTTDGGEYPIIKNGKVYYLLAANLFEADISAVQAKCEAIASQDTYKFGADCAKDLLKKHDLSVVLKTNKPTDNDVFVLDNAVIVTMQTGDEKKDIIKEGRVVVKGNKVLSVGNTWDVKIPKNAKVYNLNGGTVVPGFIDAHAHWNTPQFPVQGQWEQQLQLAYGVTTQHNPSYEDVDNYVEQDYERSGRLVAPRLFGTGAILYGAAGAYRVEINSIEDALSALRRHKAYGAWSVKSYNQPARAARQMVIEAGKRLNMTVVPEGGMHTYWNTNQIIDGHTTIEHSIPTGTIYQDLIQLFAKSGTAWTPTLIVSYGGIMGENWAYQNTNVWEEGTLRKLHPLRPLEADTFRKPAADDRDYVHFEIARSAGEVIRQGGLVNTGAHGQRKGIGYHWELKFFSQGNLTNYEVLKVATRNPAQSLGLHGVGQIKPGFLADLVVYNRENSPLKSIDHSKFIDKVVLNGFVYDAATLKRIFPTEKNSPPIPVFNNEIVHA
ncbi:hypothetical protein K502DRAFT_325401 [Neoconidiobolus thromboides FSU 785]|nr:hypothetical protein K502DRAFT_325401 [Neoconidiobolus thromboides FSU 785]